MINFEIILNVIIAIIIWKIIYISIGRALLKKMFSIDELKDLKTKSKSFDERVEELMKDKSK